MDAGQTIAGKYRLNRLLGQGGMASVWSATNVFTEREFAMKFMLPQVARTPEAARRFLLEAKVSARINHPNVIEVIDVGQAEDGSLFLVMELLSGVSLDVAIRRQRPPMLLDDFLRIMRDVAEALAVAHRSGVIHRDLKPTNIHLHKDRDGRMVPKVLDFGVSKIIEEDYKNTSLTIAGTVLGSPLYMSPEQARGESGIDGRTDVFAFGSMLFEAICGKRAFDAPNFNALIVTIATQQPLSIDSIAPELPEGVRALVRDCMATDKQHRLPSFDEVVRRLDAMIPELGSSDLRLRWPYDAEPPSDPDATEALPIVRERAEHDSPQAPQGQVHPSAPPPAPIPYAAMQITNPPRSGNGQAFVKPALERITSAALKWPPSLPVAVIAGGAVALFILLITVSFAGGRGGPTMRAASVGASVATANATATETAPAPPGASATAGANGSATATGSNVPLISVDSLPVAQKNGSARGSGRLSVAASPGWCSVTIDGEPRGVTPLSNVEITAGSHRVECTAANGKAQAANVTVGEGSSTRYRFSLE
jgi:serine/threonine protein kinase